MRKNLGVSSEGAQTYDDMAAARPVGGLPVSWRADMKQVFISVFTIIGCASFAALVDQMLGIQMPSETAALLHKLTYMGIGVILWKLKPLSAERRA